MSPLIKTLAEQQDLIGYKNFMEGRVARQFYVVQSVYLEDAGGHLNGRDWIKGMITRVLQITHSQWLYRNITFHDKQGGTLRRQEMEAMKSEAEVLACTNPLSLPEESRFLLEMDGDRYVRGDCNFHDKSYWLSAMRAAVTAGRRMARVVRRRRRTVTAMEMYRQERIRSTREDVAAQIRREFADMGNFPFNAIGNDQGKRVVVSDGTQMEMMRSNKRFKPGD